MESIVSRYWRAARQKAPNAIPIAVRDASKSFVRKASRSMLRLSARHRAICDAEAALEKNDWPAAIRRLEEWSKSNPNRGINGTSIEARLLAALRRADTAPACEFDDASIPDRPPVANPGMITPAEEKLYYTVARESYEPDRLYVEIGPWLGRSTQRICDGLDERTKDWRLVCFDRFKWNWHFSRRAAEQGAQAATRALSKGQSFEDVFRALMGPRAAHIQSVRGSLSKIEARLSPALPAGRKIGALFVDASKDWPDNARLLSFFADRLVSEPKPTQILFQDYLYFPAYKLIFLTLLLPGLTPTIFCRDGCSVVFTVRSGISRHEDVFRAGLPDTLSKAVIYAAWERLGHAIPAERLRYQSVQLALPLMLWFCRHYDAATKEFHKILLDDREKQYVSRKIGGPRNAKIPPLRALIR